ncbi:benzoate degradation ring-cleavage hydrolase [Candidatus Burkholderia humilis]|nr:benzoate degradation ring-cleavage hydrolase [Candidatus Burkholderia humilis]
MIEFAELNCLPCPVRVEYQWLNVERRDAPIAIFLHEGLGSIALWKAWLQVLCDRLKCRGLVYSRPDYGRSTPRRPEEKWPIEFLHQQAQDVLPALLDALGIDMSERKRMWLIGHSDGGSIALLYACAFPDALAGLAIMAPHVLVENMTVEAIAEVKNAFEHCELSGKLRPYHDDVSSAFYGWNDAWLSAPFRDWNIVEELSSITRPLLAIQGYDDEYASMVQLDEIKASVKHAQLLKLENCRHSPHRDMPDIINENIAAFVQAHSLSV